MTEFKVPELGENVAAGYWHKPQETERTFGGRLVAPSQGTPEERWLRTGDLGGKATTAEATRAVLKELT